MPAIGTNTSQPARTVIRPRNRTRKVTSTASTTVVEAKKSRTISIFGDAPGERAGAALALGHRQVHHLFEQLLRQLGVELAADLVDQPRARDPQDEVERQRQDHAERQHPQGRHRLVRDDPVVDVHREQRHREGEQVDDQRGEQDRPEFRADLPHFGPEPVRALGLVPRPLALALAGRVGFDDHRAAGVGRLELARA